MKKIFYIYKVTETGKYVRENKTTDIHAVENTIIYSKLTHAIDNSYRIAIIAYKNGEKVNEWKNFKD